MRYGRSPPSLKKGEGPLGTQPDIPIRSMGTGRRSFASADSDLLARTLQGLFSFTPGWWYDLRGLRAALGLPDHARPVVWICRVGLYGGYTLITASKTGMADADLPSPSPCRPPSTQSTWPFPAAPMLDTSSGSFQGCCVVLPVRRGFRRFLPAAAPKSTTELW